jgi:hypothetical protein
MPNNSARMQIIDKDARSALAEWYSIWSGLGRFAQLCKRLTEPLTYVC